MSRILKILFLVIGLIILIGFGILLYKELFPKRPQVEELKREERPSAPTEFPSEETSTKEATETIEVPTTSKVDTKANIKSPSLLIDTILLYPKIDYPYIYGYDPTNKVIKAYNIEDKTYKEIFKKDNIKDLSFSKSNLLVLFKDNNFWLLDTIKDKLIKLPINTKTAFWMNDDLYLFISSGEVNYLAKYVGDLKKVVDLYIFNPVFDYLDQNIIFYENPRKVYNSPLFLIKDTKEKVQLLEPKMLLNALTNKKDLIFVSYIENTWKSFIIDKNGNKIIEFNFGTLKEKCSFKEILICGVPKDQGFSKIDDWYYYKKTFSDKLIIFDPKNLKLDYYDLDGDFDIINPDLTPIGVIFFNRNDAKLYVVQIK
jgi:hypothetical protein